MILVIHDPAVEEIGEDERYPIPAGGRRMAMDWDCVTRALEAAVVRLCWDADLEIRPERQNVMVRVHPGGWNQVSETTSDFYALVEDAVGVETFMSIWIDFVSAKPCSTLPSS